MLSELGLLEPISAELHRGATEPLWRSLRDLDAYRARFESTPDTLTNPILLGSLLVPLGIPLGSSRYKDRSVAPADAAAAREAAPKLGALPLARRDVERLRQLLAMQRRLRDVTASPRARRALAHRSLFREALTWFEIHGSAPDLVESWKTLLAEGPVEGEIVSIEPPDPGLQRRRRRRRRRRPARPVQS
jgi:hypothetical protein